VFRLEILILFELIMKLSIPIFASQRSFILRFAITDDVTSHQKFFFDNSFFEKCQSNSGLSQDYFCYYCCENIFSCMMYVLRICAAAYLTYAVLMVLSKTKCVLLLFFDNAKSQNTYFYATATKGILYNNP
jgi:hypothetical protein